MKPPKARGLTETVCKVRLQRFNINGNDQFDLIASSVEDGDVDIRLGLGNGDSRDFDLTVDKLPQ